MRNVRDDKKVYLYDIKKGTLRCRVGQLHPYPCTDKRSAETYSYFEAGHILCSAVEGTVYNGFLWLSEPNEKIAVDSFERNLKVKILLEEEKIAGYKIIIENLDNIWKEKELWKE